MKTRTVAQLVEWLKKLPQGKEIAVLPRLHGGVVVFIDEPCDCKHKAKKD